MEDIRFGLHDGTVLQEVQKMLIVNELFVLGHCHLQHEGGEKVDGPRGRMARDELINSIVKARDSTITVAVVIGARSCRR